MPLKNTPFIMPSQRQNADISMEDTAKIMEYHLDCSADRARYIDQQRNRSSVKRTTTESAMQRKKRGISFSKPSKQEGAKIGKTQNKIREK
jgi:hypothetical protein